MKVGQLKELIKDMPDDVDILKEGPDHSYLVAMAFDDWADYVDGGAWIFEYFGDEHLHGVVNPDDGESEKRRALIVR